MTQAILFLTFLVELILLAALVFRRQQQSERTIQIVRSGRFPRAQLKDGIWVIG